MKILKVYADFAEHDVAMPVIKGEKTAGERFPGAVATYAIEAMMQDRKALQAGTSHFLGQNFAKAQDIKFTDDKGELSHAWTTSWGMSTRMVGGLIMTHSDDDGLVLPPKLAPSHVVIMPVYRSDEEKSEVLAYCAKLEQELAAQSYAGEQVRVRIDNRDFRGKKWQWVKRGVPIRLEIGPRDIADEKIPVSRRDVSGKPVPTLRAELVANVTTTLNEIQHGLLQKAAKMREDNSVHIDNLKEFVAYFTPKNEEQPEIHGGFAHCHFVDTPEIEETLKKLKVSVRCIPLDGNDEPGTCIFTGKPSTRRGVFAKAY
jgi:prolyl-tRNA synthetase